MVNYNEKIIVTPYNEEVPFYYPHVIPPGTKKICTLRVNFPDMNVILKGSALPKGLNAPDTLIRIFNGNFLMPISHLSDKPINIDKVSYELESVNKT